MPSEVTKTILPGGLRVVSEYMPHVKSVAVGVWINTGSREEDPEINGISHFLEHLAFKGTQKRNTLQIAESLEAVGGILNAFTGKEYTCFYAHALDEHLELAVDVLADLICNPLNRKEDIDKEKLIILEEITSLDDIPDEKALEYFSKNVFNGHPLSLSILGTKDSVNTINHNNIQDYIKDNYTSDRVVVAVAGNVEHERLLEYVSKYFELPAGRDFVIEADHSTGKPCKDIHNMSINQAHICIGNRALSYSSKNKYALLVMHSLLGGGMSSRLFQKLREDYGVAYSVFSFIDFYSDTGLFGVYCGVEKKNIDKSLNLINQEFESVFSEDIPDKELERLKSQLKGNLMLGLESTQSRMNRLAKMEIYLKKYVELKNVIADINSIKQDDIRKLASDILEGELFTTIIAPV
ncbi:MAG: insulinase family protein [bacterium]|nr:insulinase family protein [bacterium]